MKAVKIEKLNKSLHPLGHFINQRIDHFKSVLEGAPIKERGAKTLEDVEKYTDAGSCCGSCKNAQSDIGAEKMQLYVEEILNKFNKS